MSILTFWVIWIGDVVLIQSSGSQPARFMNTPTKRNQSIFRPTCIDKYRCQVCVNDDLSPRFQHD